MATFTLTDLKNSVSKKYANTTIENGDKSYTLVNLLQLDPKKRAAALELIDGIGSKDDEGEDDSSIDDQIEIFTEVFKIVEQDGKGDELVALLNGNAAMVLELSAAWSEASQLGEAEDSSK